jgi:hypothetical protein
LNDIEVGHEAMLKVRFELSASATVADLMEAALTRAEKLLGEAQGMIADRTASEMLSEQFAKWDSY